jgi:site-specific DNA recombinase
MASSRHGAATMQGRAGTVASELTRSVRDLGLLLDRDFAPGKAALLSVGEQIDTRSAAGRLVLNVLASVAQ